MRREARARCPLFKARVDWRGRSYILCGDDTVSYIKNAFLRDFKYKGHCCRNYQECGRYQERKG